MKLLREEAGLTEEGKQQYNGDDSPGMHQPQCKKQQEHREKPWRAASYWKTGDRAEAEDVEQVTVKIIRGLSVI